MVSVSAKLGGHRGPTARPAQAIPPKLILRISQTNVLVGVVVIQHGAPAGIRQNTRAPRSVDVVVAAQQQRASPARGAVLAALVHKGPGDALGPADEDLVLLAGGGEARVVAAADPVRVEEVIVG